MGIDPLTARKLTIEAAMFYLTGEDDTKRRCAAESKLSNPAAPADRLAEWQEEMRKRRLHFTGSEELGNE